MFQLLNALKAGQQLQDPTTWKNRQLTINAVTVLLAMIVAAFRFMGIELYLNDEALQLLAETIAGLLGFINIVLTTATTKKVGL